MSVMHPQIFMFVFVVGDIATQLLLPPSMNPVQVLTPALTTAHATLKSAVSAAGVSSFFSNDDDADLPPPGPPATVATNGVWAPGWSASVTGGASLATVPPGAFAAHFAPASVNNSDLLLHGRAAAKLRALRDSLPGVIIVGDGHPQVAVNGSDQGGPPAVLSVGTIIVMRLRTVGSGPHSVRGVEVSLGGAVATQHGNATAMHWSDGALLYTLAPGTVTAPEEWQDMQLPVPQPPRHVPAWTHLRLRYLACDGWGHALGDVDCDGESTPAQDLTLHLQSLALVPATLAARSAALKHVCEPQFLAEGRGLSALLPDMCPITALYRPVVLPPDGKYSGLHVGPLDGGSRPLPQGGMEGDAQGFRCADVIAHTRMGAKLARGWSTHKSVYKGVYRPPGGGKAVPVVVKEGGLRYPAPFQGERGVGFSPNQTAEEQRAALQTMWFEMSQEVHISELLAGHPGIPAQLGACMDAKSLLATSVQAMGGVHIGTKADLVALARRSVDPPLAALKLVRSTVSLFYFLTEQRYLRLEDLHWQVFDLRGNVRTNFSEVEGNAYADDDLSQFSVDSDDLDTGLHLMLIDLDKILISHDFELRWYVAEQSMPFVAAQLLAPLSPLLPGLRVAMQRMLDPNVLLRPPSFQCLIDWAADPEAVTWMASRAQGDWKDLPCDPAVYNKDVRSRWENPHFGRRR
jgi:hypothetical protein